MIAIGAPRESRHSSSARNLRVSVLQGRERFTGAKG